MRVFFIFAWLYTRQLHQLTATPLPAGLVVDACNRFRWPEDAECIVKLLSSILVDTANVQIVVMLPEAYTLSRSQWIVDTPPRMSR